MGRAWFIMPRMSAAAKSAKTKPARSKPGKAVESAAAAKGAAPLSKSEVFDQLHAMLKQYAPPFSAISGGVKNKRAFGLVSKKQVTIAGRERDEVYFAGVIEQKHYVGFYYMPVYAKPAMKKIFKPELLGLLKGKSCFYVKALPAELKQQIKDALDAGLAEYKKNGWV